MRIKGLRREQPEQITVDREEKQWTDTVKYLGVHMDKNSAHKKHVDETIKKAKQSRARPTR